MGQQKNMMKGRDISFDIARALSALWVVGVWHLLCYDNNINYANTYTQMVTDVFLAVFMFISGFMLNKYKFNNWKDVLVFYKKRFLRFYVLYFLSCITLFIGGNLIGNPMIQGYKQLVLSLTGLSIFMPPHLGTLWFICMIMFFYLITPLLNCVKIRLSGRILISIAFLVFFVIWESATGYLEHYVYILYPIYIIGLLLPRNFVLVLKANIGYALSGLAIAVLFFLILPGIKEHDFAYYTIYQVFVLGGVLFVLCSSNTISKLSHVSNRFFQWMAYSSLCAYLFHRHVYSLLHSLFVHLGVTITVVHLWMFFLPIAFLCAYCIQLLYDILLERVTSNKTNK